MVTEFEKMEKAKIVLTKIAKGIDPLTGEQIKVVMNDNGKKYLLDNIEEIMGIEVSDASQEVR